MSSRMQLSPAELDRLEDALEDLELLPPPPLDEDDAVGQQLLEYREILQLGREAMPLEEVPAGLLDDVLEQARQAAANTAPASPSWWSRLRMGMWVPTLAFAGSAALLLVLLWPAAEDEAGEDTVARAEPASEATPAATPPAEGERRLADAVLEQRSEEEGEFVPGQAVRGDGVGLGRAGEVTEEDEQEAQDEASRSGKRRARGPSIGRKSSGGSKGGLYDGDDPLAPLAPEPKPKPKPSSKSKAPGSTADEKKTESPDLMREVIEGDKARWAGNCGLAKMRYDKARSSEDDRVRARALAGKGLCEAAAGNATKAKKLFEQARAADSGVGSFIQAELDRLDGAPASDPPQAAEQADVQAKE